MPRTPGQLQQATREVEMWLDTLDPVATKLGDTTDLRLIASAADAVHAAEAQLRATVEVARAHGRSWGRIGMALGVTRQAARQRFATRDSVADDDAANAPVGPSDDARNGPGIHFAHAERGPRNPSAGAS